MPPEKEAGAKRAIKLNVQRLFIVLLWPAQEKLAADLLKLEYSDFEVPIVITSMQR